MGSGYRAPNHLNTLEEVRGRLHERCQPKTKKSSYLPPQELLPMESTAKMLFKSYQNDKIASKGHCQIDYLVSHEQIWPLFSSSAV